MPLRVSLARLGGAGVLGLMLAAPLVLLFLQYEPLSFNVHKPEPTGGRRQTRSGASSTGSSRSSPSAPHRGLRAVRNWFGVAVGISALVAMSGRAETKRLHAWLFVALAGALLLKIYEFRVFGWVGRLPVVELVVFPMFAAACRLVRVCGPGRNRRSGAVESRPRPRRFLTLLADGIRAARRLHAHRRPLGVITGAPHDYAAAVWGRGAFFAALAVAAVVVGVLARPSLGRASPRGVVVAELFVLAPFSIYAKRADPYVAPGWMPLVRTAQAARPPLARVRDRRQALSEHGRCPRAPGRPRARRAVRQPVPAIRARRLSQPSVYDRFTGTEPPILLQDNPMFDAFAARAVVSQSDLVGASRRCDSWAGPATRACTRTPTRYPRAWVVHDVHLVAARTTRSRFSRLARVARTGRSSSTVRPSARGRGRAATGSRRTRPCARCRSGRIACDGGDRDRVSVERYSGRLGVAPGPSSLRRAARPARHLLPGLDRDGERSGTRDLCDRRRVPRRHRAEGDSRVEFRYEPRAFSIGIVVALAGLAAFVLVGLVVWRRGRSRPRAVRRRAVDPSTAMPADRAPSIRPRSVGWRVDELPMFAGRAPGRSSSPRSPTRSSVSATPSWLAGSSTCRSAAASSSASTTATR